ncbi:MAG: hypothetical protein JKY45_13885 [Emcibacter sp.]|nr:hypothetical protein [Emcibacter sp.]
MSVAIDTAFFSIEVLSYEENDSENLVSVGFEEPSTVGYFFEIDPSCGTQ